MSSQKLTETCNQLRTELQQSEELCRALLQNSKGQFNNEVGANLMLSIRHIEDARMRLGKAIQYAGDGVSCFNKKPV